MLTEESGYFDILVSTCSSLCTVLFRISSKTYDGFLCSSSGIISDVSLCFYDAVVFGEFFIDPVGMIMLPINLLLDFFGILPDRIYPIVGLIVPALETGSS